MIPAGAVRISVSLRGDARGLGQNVLHASAKVTAISTMLEP